MLILNQKLLDERQSTSIVEPFTDGNGVIFNQHDMKNTTSGIAFIRQSRNRKNLNWKKQDKLPELKKKEAFIYFQASSFLGMFLLVVWIPRRFVKLKDHFT